MIPAKFDYHRATSLDDAVSLLAAHPGAKVLAGGHSLIPMMKLRLAQPPALVDVGRVAELKGIRAAGADAIVVGALSRHAEIAASELVRAACPLLAEAAGKIGDPQVRNRGTIGGNVAHADPASDLPAVLVALGATLLVRGPAGERRVPAKSFFVDLLATDLHDGEVLTAVELPRAAAGTGACYLKVEHPASGYAVCGAAAWVRMDGGRCAAAGLAFNGVSATPVDGSAVAAALVGGTADDAAIAAAVDGHLTVHEPLGDLQASGEYRVELARVYGRRALATARDRARG
jgi:aerobic carbon-monoxide dehydrogenase medium subunit